MDVPFLEALKARLDRQPELLGGTAHGRGLELGGLESSNLSYSLIV